MALLELDDQPALIQNKLNYGHLKPFAFRYQHLKIPLFQFISICWIVFPFQLPLFCNAILQDFVCLCV